ncbi:hypothetical protein ACJX0J_032760, partial [Zea mays]
ATAYKFISLVSDIWILRFPFPSIDTRYKNILRVRTEGNEKMDEKLEKSETHG